MVTSLEIKDDEESLWNEVETRQYRSIVGISLCLAIKARPDLFVAASILGSHAELVKEMNWIPVKRVLRYLNGNKGIVLALAPREGNQIVAFENSKWGPQYELNGKNRTGA